MPHNLATGPLSRTYIILALIAGVKRNTTNGQTLFFVFFFMYFAFYVVLQERDLVCTESSLRNTVSPRCFALYFNKAVVSLICSLIC